MSRFSSGWNCWWVIMREDGGIKAVGWRELDDYILSGWEIIEWFRADTRGEAQTRAVKHGDLV